MGTPKRPVSCFCRLMLVTGVMLASPLFLCAQENDAATATVNSGTEHEAWWRGITYGGLVSFFYEYNTNDPVPPVNQFRVFDYADNAPRIDEAQLVVQRAVSKNGDFGFRVNFIAGSGVPEVTASYGLFRNNESGEGRHYDLPEFYASYIVPVGKGLRLDGGKFVTPFGYENINSYENYNDNFSRGFIFGYGLPFTQMGLKGSYALSGSITAAVLLTNGCDAVKNLNGKMTVAAELAVTMSRTTSVTVNYLHGPAEPHNGHDQRALYEAVATWKMTPRVALAMDGLYADEDHAAPNGSDAIWKGLAGYVRYGVTKKFSLAFRGEVFADPSGVRTGTAQTLRGFTLTPEYVTSAHISRLHRELKHFNGQFVIRGEFRQDFSNVNAFRRGTNQSDGQFTTAINLMYVF
jgi:hypothetical protein